jgi:hypothetical protein
MGERSFVVAWVLREHYDNDLKKASKATDFTIKQLTEWRDGTLTPFASSVSRLVHHAFEPAFTIIAEFKPIEHDGTMKGVYGQLSTILKGFHKASGVFAFYDSSGNPLYLGKADGTLLAETFAQIKAKVAKKSAFPRDAPQPKIRLAMVRYISAYRVNKSEFEDYAKHVEALILRIHKPPLNIKSGKLNKAEPDADQG